MNRMNRRQTCGIRLLCRLNHMYLGGVPIYTNFAPPVLPIGPGRGITLTGYVYADLDKINAPRTVYSISYL